MTTHSEQQSIESSMALDRDAVVSIVQGALIYTGRTGLEYEGFLSDATLDDIAVFFGRDRPELADRKLLWDIYNELRLRVECGQIKPVRRSFMGRDDGTWDPRSTTIRIIDLVHLARDRREKPDILAHLVDALDNEDAKKSAPQPQREIAKRIIRDQYPEGLPPRDKLSNRKIREKCKKELGDISDDTVDRAIQDLRPK